MNENNNRSDLIFEKQKMIHNNKNNMSVTEFKNKNIIHKIIKFSKNFDEKLLSKKILKSIKELFEIENIKKNFHVFVVGIGNDSHTADAVGPKVLKHIKVNTQFEYFDIEIVGNRVSTLEPGVLGETGIDTGKIVESIVDQIKPDVVIIIDAVVAKKINNLNTVIEITNAGMTPGSGVKANNYEIGSRTLNVPVIVIGVATAIEIKRDNLTYLLSTSDIEKYVDQISRIIGETLNEFFY